MDLPFTLDDLKNSGLEEALQDQVELIQLVKVAPQHHSLTGVVNLHLSSGQRKKVFFKKHTDLPHEHSSATDPLQLLHRREGNSLHCIYNNINRTLVPQLLGRVSKGEEDLLLFTEYLGENSHQEKFISLEKKIHQASAEERSALNRERINLLLQDFKDIARFNGLCRAHKHQLPSYFHTFSGLPEEAYKYKQKLQQQRTFNYLLRTVHFWELGGREFQLTAGQDGKKFNLTKQNSYLRYIRQAKKLDLSERLSQIFEYKKAIKTKIHLQHGDSRIQHIIDGKFCDLEDFGYYPWYHDIVTYTSREITTPPIDQIPSLLACYLVYERAYGSKSHDFTIKEIENLDQEDPQDIQKLLYQRVKGQDFADFTLGYVADVLIENDLIQDGINKKYSLSRLQEIYPYCLYDQIHRFKLDHLTHVYNNFTSLMGSPVLAYCSNREGVRSFFYHLGSLIQDLGLSEIDKLGGLSSASQWNLFFGQNES